tara:strand:+ start:242 stop:637 length:396 start_codon:yes stop_codon:yes gene_type:complete
MSKISWRPLFVRQCSNCKLGMSSGYIYHEGEELFCKDECVGKFFGDKKAFTSFDDWNNDGPGLTWKEFQNHWDNINDYDNNAFEFACEVMSYTEWEETDIFDNELFDLDGNCYSVMGGSIHRSYIELEEVE